MKGKPHFLTKRMREELVIEKARSYSFPVATGNVQEHNISGISSVS